MAHHTYQKAHAKWRELEILGTWHMKGRKVQVGNNPEIKWEEGGAEKSEKEIWEIRNAADKSPPHL